MRDKAMAYYKKKLLVEPNNTWLRSSLVWTLVTMTAAASVWATMFYASVDSLAVEFRRDREDRARERAEFLDGLHAIRDELRKLITDSVAQRQATGWIDQTRLLNLPLNEALKAKGMPPLIFPDLPR